MTRNLTLFSLFAIMLVSLVSCGSKDNPEAVADKFLNHIARGEFEKASEYASKQTGQMLALAAAFSEGSEFEQKSNHKDLKCEIDGDTAKCTYTMDGETEVIDLIKEDGKWKVHQKKE